MGGMAREKTCCGERLKEKEVKSRLDLFKAFTAPPALKSDILGTLGGKPS